MKRVAIVGGFRTPFCRAFTAFRNSSALEMGINLIEHTVKDLELSHDTIEELQFSTVLLDPRIPNLAREIVLRSNELPKKLSAHFVSNNCISGLVAANAIAESIRSERISCGLAGGAESMSMPSLTFKREAEKFFLKLSRSRSIGATLRQLLSFRPGFCAPVPPSPKEPSTGLTMGQHCELTAQEFEVGRAEQDKWAYQSHMNASKAQMAGVLGEEIAPFCGESNDNFIRPDTSEEKLAKLRPVFEKSDKGTLTAGNSSGLTDGASVVCLMSEEKARETGREILGFIERIEFSAIDPNDGLLMAPALAVPKLLERSGNTVADIDLFEIHEAFAAQVISNRLAWEKGWQKYPELKSIGSIPEEKINPNGGSIAIGHPFAATGGRLLLSASRELKRSGKKKAVISVCAAGAMGAAVLISRDGV